MNIADDRVVYMAFNGIFQGQDSQIRNLAAIKRLVRKHEEQPQVAQLLEEYSAPVIYKNLQRLLVGQIFESTVKAKMEFPELFEVSPAQSADRSISEAEAAAGHAKAVEEAIASTERHGKAYDSDYESGGTDTDPEGEEPSRPPSRQDPDHLGTGIPSLFPLEFDFITSHSILIKTQEVLESACFRFAEKAMPEILQKREWHCPESAELNLWAVEFLKRLKVFGKRAFRAPSPSKPLKELLPSIAQIRHHAVHRIPVTAKELEQFMLDGETLAQIFEDQSAIDVMSRAKHQVQKAAAEMENRKNMLETRLAKVLQEVADKRAELDRIEEEAIADMQRKDKEHQLFAGACLQENIWSDDSAIEEKSIATRHPAVCAVDNDRLEDQIDTNLESFPVSHEDSNVEDAAGEGPRPPILGDTYTGGPDRDDVPAEVEEAFYDSLELANVEEDGGETEGSELSLKTPTDMHGKETGEPGWPRVFKVLRISNVEK